MKATQIAFEDMASFLEERGFSDLGSVAGNEVVYGKRIPSSIAPLTLRVFTSFAIGGEYSRAKDSDAIRVIIFTRKDSNDVVSVCNIGRVYRVEGWRENLEKKINVGFEHAIKECPSCKKFMVLRKNHKTKDLFYGCTSYPECRYTKPVQLKLF